MSVVVEPGWDLEIDGEPFTFETGTSATPGADYTAFSFSLGSLLGVAFPGPRYRVTVADDGSYFVEVCE